MTEFEIIPLTGIRYADKIVSFSAKQEDVEKIFGISCTKVRNSLYYFNNELRFDFDNSGRLEFIEFLGGIGGIIRPQIYGISAFEAAADELFGILSEKNNGFIADNENGHSYAFTEISVGIFRERIPEEVREMEKEYEKHGAPISTVDIAAELRMAEHWGTIGVGIKKYYG